MAKSDRTQDVERLHRERQRAEREGDTARVRQIDEELAEAEQQGQAEQ